MYIKHTHKIERDDAFILRCLPRKIAITCHFKRNALLVCDGRLIKAVNIYCISTALSWRAD